ncbi:hypothetical protein MBLNU230_g6631t1 [Neophaeotheca triangularis]
MPLILLSGFPSSGKTHRASQLAAHFTDLIASPSAPPHVSKYKVLHINSDDLTESRNTIYATANAEKTARATFSSAIKRHLSPTTIVIADGPNYIKGFRYQLYCEAKALRTPNCVVQTATPVATCRELNEQTAAQNQAQSQPEPADSTTFSPSSSPKEPYNPEIFENLIFRYEEPNPMTRWDSPLFAIAHADAEPPYAAIWETLVGSDGTAAKTIRPNAATVLQPAGEENFLYKLDRITSEVISAIGQWGSDHAGEGGGEVVIGRGDGEAKLVVLLPATGVPSLPQLQRLRRQFVGLHRQQSAAGMAGGRVRELFVDYLNDSFEK